MNASLSLWLTSMNCKQNKWDFQGILKNRKNWLGCLSLISLPVATLITTGVIQSAGAAPFNGCNGGDCVQHSLQTQAACVQVGTEAAPNAPVGPAAGWAKGLNTEIDQNILKANVVAYKIKWSSGWSGWFVTGVNDLDVKFNTNSGDMRRMWAYFTDHQHLYLVCKQP
jgi:hypothetical protein